jgi:hypothetical protein
LRRTLQALQHEVARLRQVVRDGGRPSWMRVKDDDAIHGTTIDSRPGEAAEG